MTDAHILAWLVMTLAVGGVAHYKGRHVGLWALAGFLFGIFALIAVACLKNLRKEKQ